MKDYLTTLATMLMALSAVMWITPSWLTGIMEWLLTAAVILWFFARAILV